MGERTEVFYEFDVFRIDAHRRRLLREGEPVPLATKAFDTLLVLVENRGRVVDKDELMKRVWPDSFVEEANLTQNIFILRKVLGESPTEHQYIVTVPRRGYRFVARVTECSDESAAPEPPAPSRSTVTSIAVLPFRSLVSDSDNQYLELGMADALITRLSNLRQIVVRPTSAVLKFSGLTQDPLAAGRELRVDAVLEGSIRRSGDRMRATVQLVSVQAGVTLWAAKFDEKFSDIFDVEDSISQRVADALALKLTAEDRRLLTRRYTENTEAYQLYLKGRYYGNRCSKEGFEKAVVCFHNALEMDPEYALAYAGLAEAYNNSSTFHLTPTETLPRMKHAAKRALELDDMLSEAHTILATATMNDDWNWGAAENEFKRAIEINPSLATAHLWYGWLLTLMGRFDDSLNEFKRAQQLDPVSPVINAFIASPFYYGRRYDQAIGELNKAIELEPNFWLAHWILGMAYEQKGDVSEAIASFERAKSLDDSPLILALLGRAFALAGKTREAQDTVAELKELSEKRFVSPYHIALIYDALGEPDLVFEFLGEAYEERDESLPVLNVDPRLDSLRTDPRYEDLLRRIGLSL